MAPEGNQTNDRLCQALIVAPDANELCILLALYCVNCGHITHVSHVAFMKVWSKIQKCSSTHSFKDEICKICVVLLGSQILANYDLKSNPKSISDLFEVKSPGYHLMNHVKVLQPKRHTTAYWLRKVSYTGAKLWNYLFPLLSNDEKTDVFESFPSLAILRGCLDPNFTYI